MLKDLLVILLSCFVYYNLDKMSIEVTGKDLDKTFEGSEATHKESDRIFCGFQCVHGHVWEVSVGLTGRRQ